MLRTLIEVTGGCLCLFAVVWLGDAIERWLIALWSRPTHRPGEALSLAVGPAVAMGFALAVILLAVALP